MARSKKTWFLVEEGGTLSAGKDEVGARYDAYSLSKGDVKSRSGLVAAMEECQPLQWLVREAYVDARETLSERLEAAKRADTKAKLAARLEAMPDDEDDETLSDWVSGLSGDEFKALRKDVMDWLANSPDLGEEEDYFVNPVGGQGIAMDFFEGMSANELGALGITIVEGEHPASTYYAAELKNSVEQANKAAQRLGLNIGFRRAP